MTINDPIALISSGETRTLELKKTTGELKDGMHSAYAFLNTEGGWLIFGITLSNKHETRCTWQGTAYCTVTKWIGRQITINNT